VDDGGASDVATGGANDCADDKAVDPPVEQTDGENDGGAEQLDEAFEDADKPGKNEDSHEAKSQADS
jgi:hypothetical protein